jgi:hypothetical protein
MEPSSGARRRDGCDAREDRAEQCQGREQELSFSGTFVGSVSTVDRADGGLRRTPVERRLVRALTKRGASSAPDGDPRARSRDAGNGRLFVPGRPEARPPPGPASRIGYHLTSRHRPHHGARTTSGRALGAESGCTRGLHRGVRRVSSCHDRSRRRHRGSLTHGRRSRGPSLGRMLRRGWSGDDRRRGRRSGSGSRAGGRRGSGSGRRRRLGSGRRRGCRRRGRRPRRKEREWVDVRLAVGEADSEVHVREVVLGVARRSRLRDRFALLDDVATSHEQRAEVRERRLVTAGRDDRDRRAVRRDLTGERHLSGRRRANGRSAVQGDVDAAVLSARVWVVADGVTAQHGAVGWPGPRERVGGRHEQPAEGRKRDDGQSRCPVR